MKDGVGRLAVVDVWNLLPDDGIKLAPVLIEAGAEDSSFPTIEATTGFVSVHISDDPGALEALPARMEAV